MTNEMKYAKQPMLAPPYDISYLKPTYKLLNADEEAILYNLKQ